MQESTVTMQIPEGSRPGEAPLENLWDSSSIKELKVYFMNPDVLQAENRQWLYGHNGLEPMSTQIILEWAIRGWKDARYEEYPRISPVAALKIDRSHIRVEFAEECMCNMYMHVFVEKCVFNCLASYSL